MLDLAQNQKDGFVALKDIAERQDISKKYLEQIVPILNRAGLLKTTRGYRKATQSAIYYELPRVASLPLPALKMKKTSVTNTKPV